VGIGEGLEGWPAAVPAVAEDLPQHCRRSSRSSGGGCPCYKQCTQWFYCYCYCSSQITLLQMGQEQAKCEGGWRACTAAHAQGGGCLRQH
jgi:hypothetical protein